MFWRQDTSLGFNYPSRRPRASRPSISSQLLFACPFACRLLGFFLGDGPMARLSVDIFPRPHRRQCLVLLARGNWRCPFASQKHTLRGLPRSKQRSGHPTWHHVVLSTFSAPVPLSRPSTKRSTKVAAVAGDDCWGVGTRPTSRLGV